MATGTITANTLPHQKCSSRNPPVNGPVATPTPVMAPQIPMARARRRRSGKVCAMIESVVGKMTAAPTPITARAATSEPTSETIAPTAAATPKIESPTTSAPRRPYRSARLPAASTKPANVRL